MVQLIPSRLILLIASALAVVGCTDIRMTEPDRTANEQLLISTAADHAIAQFDFSGLDSRSVFLDTSYLESYDKSYVIGAVRSKLAESGGALAKSADTADYIVEIRSGALSINREKTYVGVGGFEVPFPFSEAIQLPLATFYEDFDRTAIAKFATVTLSAEDGSLVDKSGTIYGLAWIDKDAVLGFGWDSTNTLPSSVRENLRPNQ